MCVFALLAAGANTPETHATRTRAPRTYVPPGNTFEQDQYANYVIQKTLQLAPRDAALTLVESIREHLTLMRNSSGGRRMLTKIAKRFPVRNSTSFFAGGATRKPLLCVWLVVHGNLFGGAAE